MGRQAPLLLALFALAGCEATFGGWGSAPAGQPGATDGGDGRRDDDEDLGPASDDGSDGDAVACTDLDGDGHGAGCAAGYDCDDGDPARAETCNIVSFGAPWDGAELEGLEVDPDGALTLGEDVTDQDDSVWVANSIDSTVTRLDAPTGHELARYPSVLPDTAGARPVSEECNMRDAGNCPSRTAIDFARDAWVANRAIGNQGTVSKIAGRTEHCIDRNGNGAIDTSRDDDGDGRISAGEIRSDDECVLFTIPVGDDDGVPRALAIAPDPRRSAAGGNAWVGCNRDRRATELDGDTGEVLREVDLPLDPYGALAGKVQGLVWFVNAGWQSRDDNPPAIVAVAIETGEVQPRIDVRSTTGCVGSYGLSLDEAGRVWVGGNPCEAAFRYDPGAGEWLTVDITGQGWPRGIVAAGDGTVWVAHSTLDGETVGRLTKVDSETGDVLVRYELPTGLDAIGVDLDREGNVWTVNRRTSNVSKLDPGTDRFQEFDVGRGPYTYSDFTGHSLRLQFPRGAWRGVAEACGGEPASWLELRWEGDVPAGASITTRARSAATREGLEAAPWAGPWDATPADLSALEPGGFLEIELTLESDDGAFAPTLTSVGATFDCPIE